jgi:hypothetical protein
VAGPMAVFITIGPGVTPAAARRSLDQVTAVLNRSSDPDGPVGGVVSVLRPAEIADYHAVGSTPSVLAAILAAGAIGALGLTLIASVRRRRREFALLKTLGFTQRQLAATVAWQSSVPAIVGVIFGLPAMFPASARPPLLAHSPRATSCRNNQHRPHRSLDAAAPLKPLTEPVDLDQYRVRRQARVGGLINEYRLVA